MQHFIDEISVYVNDIRSIASYYEWHAMEGQFEDWKNEHNKHDVENYYSDPLFGACYTSNLFSARVHSFDQVLQILGKNSNVRRIFEHSKSIVSFGCGPGPDIVAYVAYVREELQLPYLPLKILAVDKFRYWSNYIEKLNYCDSNANMTFQQGTLCVDYLKRIHSHDICLMSYPHSINFEKGVWYMLKQKFNLIIVLDQAKRVLHRRVRNAGYQVEQFYFKGDKWFFYYIDEDLEVDSDCDSDSDDELPFGGYQNKYYESVPGVISFTPISMKSNVTVKLESRISSISTTVDQISLKSILNTTSQVLAMSTLPNISNTIRSNTLCFNGIHNSPSGLFHSCSSLIRVKLLCNHECEYSCHSVKLQSKQSQTYYDLFDFEHLIECNETCNVRLKCGHYCKSPCRDCSRPHFHGPCKEQCQKLFSCGNKCGNRCHIDECRQCYKNCLLCRFKNFFRTQIKLSKSEKDQWNCIRNILDSKMPNDIRNHVNVVLDEICSDSFSHSIFGEESFSSDGFRRLILFYNEMLSAQSVTLSRNRIFLEYLVRQCENIMKLFDSEFRSCMIQFYKIDLWKFQVIYSKIKSESCCDISKFIRSLNL